MQECPTCQRRVFNAGCFPLCPWSKVYGLLVYSDFDACGRPVIPLTFHSECRFARIRACHRCRCPPEKGHFTIRDGSFHNVYVGALEEDTK